MLEKLIEIQDNRNIIKKSKKELKGNLNMNSIKKIKDEFEQEKERYKCIDNNLKKLQIKIQNIENALSDISKEVASEEDKLYRNLKYDFKLINSLKKSIESKKNKMKELEDENLKLLYEEEELLEKKKNSKEKLTSLRDDFYEGKKIVSEKVIKIKKDIERSEQNILNCEKCVPEELLNEFNKISSVKGTGAAMVSQGVCMGCKVKVSAVTIDNIKNNVGVVYCDNCGRIINC